MNPHSRLVCNIAILCNPILMLPRRPFSSYLINAMGSSLLWFHDIPLCNFVNVTKATYLNNPGGRCPGTYRSHSLIFTLGLHMVSWITITLLLSLFCIFKSLGILLSAESERCCVQFNTDCPYHWSAIIRGDAPILHGWNHKKIENCSHTVWSLRQNCTFTLSLFS